MSDPVWEDKIRLEFEEMAKTAYNGDIRRAPKCPHQYANAAVNHAWFGYLKRAKFERFKKT